MTFFETTIILDTVVSIVALAVIGAFAAPTLVVARRRTRVQR
jgi:hypothetical protein